MSFVSLIQGASRGIGLQYTKYLLSKGNKVVATCRNPQQAFHLIDLKNMHHSNLQIIQLDVTQEESIEKASQEYLALYGKNSLQLLVNSAGILSPQKKGETSIKDLKLSDMLETFTVNCIGPAIVCKYFSPFMEIKQEPAKIVNLSAGVGSITDNNLGGWYQYRMSKAALNMLTKSLSIELKRKNIITISLYPGAVKTDFTIPYQKSMKNIQEVEEATLKHFKIIENLNMQDHNGCFIDKDGKNINW